MLQFQFMAPWIPTFNQSIESELIASNNDPPFITFQFATVDVNGFPHNRTLVYRGFLFDDKSTNIITFTTDKRTNKYQELINNDKFEAVFYFPKLKKQFRFRGKARIIDDHYRPIMDLSTIQPMNLLNSNSISSDSDGESDEENLVIKPKVVALPPQIPKTEPQLVPISSSLISPSLLSQLNNSSRDVSYTNLHDLSVIEFRPPSSQEWDQEIKRHWYNLSKNLKKSFRRPSPKTSMNAQNLKLIDSISRGVDGKKDEEGLKNFCLVGLFIDYVDFVELEKDRRYIYEMDNYQQWNESEVCP